MTSRSVIFVLLEVSAHIAPLLKMSLIRLLVPSQTILRLLDPSRTNSPLDCDLTPLRCLALLLVLFPAIPRASYFVVLLTYTKKLIDFRFC